MSITHQVKGATLLASALAMSACSHGSRPRTQSESPALASSAGLTALDRPTMRTSCAEHAHFLGDAAKLFDARDSNHDGTVTSAAFCST